MARLPLITSELLTTWDTQYYWAMNFWNHGMQHQVSDNGDLLYWDLEVRAFVSVPTNLTTDFGL